MEMTNTNVSPRFDGSVELTAADVERMPYVSLLPGDFTEASRTPQGGQRPHLERLRQGHRHRLQADVPLAQRWRRAERGRLPLPRPVRKQDTWRTAHPLWRGVPDDLLQGLTGSPRPRRRSGGA